MSIVECADLEGLEGLVCACRWCGDLLRRLRGEWW